MKLISVFLLVLIGTTLFAQNEKRFQIEGRVSDSKGLPISDAYIINFRNQDRYVSKENGVFNIWVLPSDSLLISHIGYHKKIISVYNLLKNPFVELRPDSVNITEINVSPDQKTDYQKAMENINAIEFEFKPTPSDAYTETERMESLLQTENRVERTAASSVSIFKFSPSEQLNTLFEKLKKKDASRQYNSTKKIKKQESK
jgi:hypothetical protein